MKKRNFTEQDILKYTFWAVLISIVVALVIFNFDLIFHRCFKIDKQSFGLFGDFYGGLLATIASIFALIYIMLTFINSKKESDFEMINRLYDNIVDDIDSIQYRRIYKHRKRKDSDNDEFLPKEECELYTGIDALYNFDHHFKENPNSVLNHLNLILNSFEQIVLMAKRIRYKWGDMKWITIDRIYLLYYSKILWPVYERIIKEHGKSLLNDGNDDFKESIATLYAKLSLDTLDYLSGGQLARLPKKELRSDENKKPIKHIDVHKKSYVIDILKEIELTNMIK